MSNGVVRCARADCARQLRSLVITALAVTSWSLPLGAQATYPPPVPDPSTCPIKAGIKSFVIEEALGPTGFSSAFTATFPPAAIAALTNPNVEVRVHVKFDTTSMIVKNYTIPVPLGSPAITPDTTDFDALAVAGAFAKIDNVYTACYPRPSVMITGHITTAATIFGDQTGPRMEWASRSTPRIPLT